MSMMFSCVVLLSLRCRRCFFFCCHQATVLVFLTLVAAPSDSVLSFRVLTPGSTTPLSVRLPLTLPDFLRYGHARFVPTCSLSLPPSISVHLPALAACTLF
jgi:hypothetical protein